MRERNKEILKKWTPESEEKWRFQGWRTIYLSAFLGGFSRRPPGHVSPASKAIFYLLPGTSRGSIWTEPWKHDHQAPESDHDGWAEGKPEKGAPFPSDVGLTNWTENNYLVSSHTIFVAEISVHFLNNWDLLSGVYVKSEKRSNFEQWSQKVTLVCFLVL